MYVHDKKEKIYIINILLHIIIGYIFLQKYVMV